MVTPGFSVTVVARTEFRRGPELLESAAWRRTNLNAGPLGPNVVIFGFVGDVGIKYESFPPFCMFNCQRVRDSAQSSPSLSPWQPGSAISGAGEGSDAIESVLARERFSARPRRNSMIRSASVSDASLSAPPRRRAAGARPLAPPLHRDKAGRVTGPGNWPIRRGGTT